MSESNPEVIQGRLGIESGDVTELKPEELEPHPKNAAIYGDTESVADLPETFVKSIREKGVLEPLVITEGKQIISGHRRWLAAKHLDVDRVPVRKTAFDDDLTEREALIEFNRQREKTPGQVVNEFEEMLAIEKERARERERSGGMENFPQGDTGKAREKAAEKVNADVSGRTLEKGKTVKDKAHSDDEPEQVREAAQEAWGDLKSGDESFHGAHQRVKDAASDDDTEQHDVVDAATKQETDEWSSPRELVEPLSEALDGFDLDPCSGAETSPFASETYTESDNGLEQPWTGTVWVNPPYSDMAAWTEKAIAESERGAVDTIYYLCKGDSSTAWWQDAIQSASVVLAIDRRLSFGDGDNSAPFPSHIFVFGMPESAELDALADHGVVLTQLLVGDSNE